MAGVDWCKCSFVEIGFWGGSVSTEMPVSASTEIVGLQWTEILGVALLNRKTPLGQSLFLKITIMHFEDGPLGFDADAQVPQPKV